MRFVSFVISVLCFNQTLTEIYFRTKESKPGVLSSIWNWGFKKADSFEEPLPSSPPKKERRSKKKRGFLPSLVASVFGADLIEVGNILIQNIFSKICLFKQ